MTAAFVRNAGTTAPENTAGKEPRKFPGAMATCLGLCALNLVLQLAWHGGALGDGILSSRHPASADALEYARAAGTLARGFGEAGLAGFARAFGEAFGDGWRMPGYPLFLALFQGADAPWRAARLAQILLTVPLGAIVFIILRSARARPLAALVGGLLAALWLPLYHYSPALLAEAPSLALMGALLAALAARKPTLAGTLVAALAYLKPNHLLLLLPVALFLLADAGDGTRPLSPSLRARLARVLIAAAVTAALVAPWSLYLSRRHDGFVPLTLNGGYNLLLGTGRIAQGDPEALPRRAAKALGLQATEDAGADPDGEPTARGGVVGGSATPVGGAPLRALVARRREGPACLRVLAARRTRRAVSLVHDRRRPRGSMAVAARKAERPTLGSFRRRMRAGRGRAGLRVPAEPAPEDGDVRSRRPGGDRAGALEPRARARGRILRAFRDSFLRRIAFRPGRAGEATKPRQSPSRRTILGPRRRPPRKFPRDRNQGGRRRVWTCAPRRNSSTRSAPSLAGSSMT